MNISTLWFLFLLVSISANILQWNLDKQDWIPECPVSELTQEIVVIEEKIATKPQECIPEIRYEYIKTECIETECIETECIKTECLPDPDVAVWQSSSDSWKYRAELAERTLKQMGINPKNL